MEKDPIIYLEHILDAIAKIEDYLVGKTFADFAVDTEKQDAIIRRIEIIGEAVKNLPLAVRTAYPKVPWRQITGMRDFLVHEYFRVNIESAWKVATEDLVKLKRQIKTILKKIADK